jgi:hypothetical protein
MKKVIIVVLSLTIALLCLYPAFRLDASTATEKTGVVPVTSAATLLDGTTAGQTYKAVDLPRTQRYLINASTTDGITINAYGTGSDSNTCVFNIWGYPINGPARPIYTSVTATLGTAVAGATELYVESFSGTDEHLGGSGVIVSNTTNKVATITFDTIGLKYIVFECTTFTTLTAMYFEVHPWGMQ